MRRKGLAARLRRATETLDLWRERRRSRAELARMSPRMFHDIGIAPGDALFEAGKPFWRP